ncbi:MAG: ABC transporter ATP-binding protein [Pseudomonadota bacterium]
MSAPLVQCQGICKDYLMGSETVHALRDVDLVIGRGEYLSIMGPSGSGKSTLMNLIGALDTPTSGELIVDGVDLSARTADELADYRNRAVGFVFQQFNLLPKTTALENVKLPLLYSDIQRSDESNARAFHCLNQVGLSNRVDHEPTQLSGGQQQRVAIARALVNNPTIILADEPTGALDTQTSSDILELFAALNETGITIIVVTHEPEVAGATRRSLSFRDGRLVGDLAVPGGGRSSA